MKGRKETSETSETRHFIGILIQYYRIHGHSFVAYGMDETNFQTLSEKKYRKSINRKISDCSFVFTKY